MRVTGPTRPVVVAMLTYRRPDDLADALPAVLAQVQASKATLLVVDNDPAGSAEPIVAGFADRPIRYVNETRPGIAAARNRALDEAPADALLIFIDDDERPTEGWLGLLLGTWAASTPAAVVGPVISEYESEPAAWLAAGHFFDRRRMLTGTTVDVAATNNLLLDLPALDGLRFDERFGESGGSDTLFTRTLSGRGSRMVWCDEAIVIDRVPASRLTREWVLRRAFRSGNSWSRTSREISRSAGLPVRLGVVGRELGQGVVRVAGGASRIVFGLLTGSLERRVRGTRTVARGSGMVAGALGFTYHEYRRKKLS